MSQPRRNVKDVRGPPGAADRELIGHAAEHGVTVTPTQLERWRIGALPLIPRNRRVGRSSEPSPGAADLVVWLGRESRPGRSPYALALMAFGDGHPVPERTVRAAFRRPVDRLQLPGEAVLTDIDDEEDRAAAVAADALDRGLDFTVVPRRVRAIDERLGNAGWGWAPEAVAVLDAGSPLHEPPTRRDFATSAVAAMVVGPQTIPGADAGAMARMMGPAGAASPFASMLERGGEAPDADPRILDDAGAMVFMPPGDMRSYLSKLLDDTPLNELLRAWRAAGRVRTWAMDLCTATERELDEGVVGPAIIEWASGVHLALPRITLLSVLRGERWGPSEQAFKVAELLMLREMIYQLRVLVPDGEYGLLQTVMPACLHEFLDLSPYAHGDNDGALRRI